MTGTVYAECTPAPDCVELGYIETSCNGGFVHCPFDINKLFCLPCDSSYKYDCSGTGEIGSGTAYNGKYIECECTDGYELVNGACIISCAYTLTALPTGCSSYTTYKSGTTTKYKCTACNTDYTLCSSQGKCIDTYCYTNLTGLGYSCNRISTLCSNGQCTGNNGEVYTIYTVCPPSSGDWS